MGCEPHLDATYAHIQHVPCAHRTLHGCRKASGRHGPTYTQGMRMLADAAGTMLTASEERPAKHRRQQGAHVTCRSRSTNTCSVRGWQGLLGASLDRPWPRRDRRTQTHDRLRGSPVDLADHSIRIELSLRLSPEADAPGLTRGDFRRFLAVMERALNIASDRPGAPGTGLWLAAGSMRSGRRDGSTGGSRWRMW